MNGKKHKEPSFNQKVADLKKKPGAVENPDQWRAMTPLWSFAKCDLEGSDWSWEKITSEDLVQVLRRLGEHESRSWKDILLDKSNGAIDMDHERLSAAAKNRLEDRTLLTFDKIYKLRVDGPGRVWGVRVERTLHIVWWDPEHGVYPMNLADN